MSDYTPNRGTLSVNWKDFGQPIVPTAEPLSSIVKDAIKNVSVPKVPSSSSLTGLEFRITGIFVRENGTDFIPWVLRYSDLYVLTFAQSDLDTQPSLLSLQGFDDVDDEEHLGIRVTPYSRVLQANDSFPFMLATYVAVIKSNHSIRDFGNSLKTVLGSSEFASASKGLQAALGVANPAGVAAWGAAETVAKILSGVLAKTTDKVLDVNFHTFSALNGDFDRIGQRDIKWKGRHVTLYTRLSVRGKH